MGSTSEIDAEEQLQRAVRRLNFVRRVTRRRKAEGRADELDMMLLAKAGAEVMHATDALRAERGKPGGQ